MFNIRLVVSDFLSRLFPSASSKSRENNLIKYVLEDIELDFTESEEKRFEAIENVRKTLKKSSESISKVDFGAGSRTSQSNQHKTENIKEVVRSASKTKSSCLLLYHVINHSHPVNALELGTCLGISTAYQALVLKNNNRGKLYSIEGSPGRAEDARKNLKELDLSDVAEVITGKFSDVLAELLPKLGFIDYAFIDGHHQEEATIEYFNMLVPWFKNGGLMVFDDIFWSPGMNRAWKTIKSSGKFEAVMIYKGMGVGVIAKP